MTSHPPCRRGFALMVVALMGLAVAIPILARATEPGPRKVTVKAGLAGDATSAETYLEANATYVRETLPEVVRSVEPQLLPKR